MRENSCEEVSNMNIDIAIRLTNTFYTTIRRNLDVMYGRLSIYLNNNCLHPHFVHKTLLQSLS